MEALLKMLEAHPNLLGEALPKMHRNTVKQKIKSKSASKGLYASTVYTRNTYSQKEIISEESNHC
jgi:hypothetical protein